MLGAQSSHSTLCRLSRAGLRIVVLRTDDVENKTNQLEANNNVNNEDSVLRL